MRCCCCCSGFAGWPAVVVPPAGIALVQESLQVAFFDAGSVIISFPDPPGDDSTVFVSLSKWPEEVAVPVAVTVGGVVATLDVYVPAGAGTNASLWRAHGPFANADVEITFTGTAYGAARADEFSGVANAAPLSVDSAGGDTVGYPDPGVDGALAFTVAADDQDGGAGHWVAPVDYALALAFAEFSLASSGATAWRVLGAPAPGVLTWQTPTTQACAVALYGGA